MRKVMYRWGAAAAALALGVSLSAGGQRAPAMQTAPVDDALTARARAIHERVMTLDTHNDINPANFTTERNYTQDLGNQVNLPKMIKGGVDVAARSRR